MPVSISLKLLTPEAAVDVKDGALTDDVMVQFICNTGDGGVHDPHAAPDSRVRPSHAAFHGKIFKLSEAPVPPLDYGCRCGIRYVAAKDSKAAQVVKATTDIPPTTTKTATRSWLQENVTDWEKIAKVMAKESPKDALTVGTKLAKALGIDNGRMIAEMILDTIS